MDQIYDVEFQNVTRKFGQFIAVDDVSFGIRKGEFFSMLGPSGSGKTTCLRMVAGFQDTTSGRVLLEGVDVTGIPPYKRNVNTVFQDYALFPHMTVAENVGYGLKIKKTATKEIEQRVADMLAMVRLPDVGNRKPSELSGGQRQRIALARALINRPGVLLLDEPLGALDLKLREEMQLELKAIQKEVGITFIFVTHDQEEALSMSDRIAVFNKGKVEQIATPEELYDRPKTEFVANFVGTSNILSLEETKRLTGQTGKGMIRPERVHVFANAKEDNHSTGYRTFKAILKSQVYSGATSKMHFETPNGSRIIASTQNLKISAENIAVGSEVLVGWKDSDMHLL